MITGGRESTICLVRSVQVSHGRHVCMPLQFLLKGNELGGADWQFNAWGLGGWLKDEKVHFFTQQPFCGFELATAAASICSSSVHNPLKTAAYHCYSSRNASFLEVNSLSASPQSSESQGHSTLFCQAAKEIIRRAGARCFSADFVLEGGSIHVDGEG